MKHWVPPQRYLLVVGTFLLAVLLYVDRVCISTAEAAISQDLRLTPEQFGWILSSFALGYALFQTPSGLLADRFGPRRVLAGVVVIWSVFTGLTGAVRHFSSLLVIRFLFGAGEAGGYPGVARAVYSWIPMRERGVVTGINFSGGRLGAAFAMPAVAMLVHDFGWRLAFAVLMLVGLVWAMGWLLWFRDNPADHSGMTAAELKQIQFDAPAEKTSANVPFAAATLLRSRNLWLAMAQYFCSNFTFFFCMTWLYPHLKKTFQLEAVAAGWYAAAPLIAGALGNILAGWLTDRIYRAGRWKLSRQAPAMLGFLLAALGLVVSVYMTTPLAAVAWLSVAIFGADMTLAPSWAFCIDIGRRNSGAVSGTMNMAGNIGSFLTSLAFPYLLKWTGTVTTFFFVGAALNGLASLLWCFVKPERPIEEY